MTAKTQHGGFRPGAGRKKSSLPRCPCGEMTLRRALSRSHKCGEKQVLIRSLAAFGQPAELAPESSSQKKEYTA